MNPPQRPSPPLADRSAIRVVLDTGGLHSIADLSVPRPPGLLAITPREDLVVPAGTTLTLILNTEDLS
jgi:hypothetical protein